MYGDYAENAGYQQPGTSPRVDATQPDGYDGRDDLNHDRRCQSELDEHSESLCREPIQDRWEGGRTTRTRGNGAAAALGLRVPVDFVHRGRRRLAPASAYGGHPSEAPLSSPELPQRRGQVR